VELLERPSSFPAVPRDPEGSEGMTGEIKRGDFEPRGSGAVQKKSVEFLDPPAQTSDSREASAP